MNNPTDSSKLGPFIREQRIQKKMTQRQLAQAAGFKSSGAISDIENGFRYPGEEFLPRLADALGISLDALQAHDDRLPIREAQHFVRDHPAYVGVFRKIVQSARELDAEELSRRIDAALGAQAPSTPRSASPPPDNP